MKKVPIDILKVSGGDSLIPVQLRHEACELDSLGGTRDRLRKQCISYSGINRVTFGHVLLRAESLGANRKLCSAEHLKGNIISKRHLLLSCLEDKTPP
jgi:hypothetical protein